MLTHAHIDHIGGLTDAAAQKTFSRAALVLSRREAEFWRDDDNFNRAKTQARGGFLRARKALDLYRADLRLFDAGEVSPGVFARPLPGHRVGHTGYRIGAGARSLLVWGDVVHFPHIQLARPEVAVIYDNDPAQAAATRSKLLDELSADNLLVAGMHLSESGFARLRRVGAGYAIDYENRENMAA